MGNSAQERDINQQEITGNLGKDVELTETSNGQPKATVNVCANRVYNGQDDGTWFRIVAYGTRAVAFARYGKKGRPVFITGRTVNSTYKGKITVTLGDGTEVTGIGNINSSEVRLSWFKWLDKKPQ